jgi:hypothetical protein
MSWIKKGNIFNGEWAQLPVVDVYDGFYKIYYSTRNLKGQSIPRSIKADKNTLKPTNIPPNGNVFFIPLGKPGSFDSDGVMPTDIVTLSNGWKYLYYVGWSKRLDIPYWNSLGMAISKDNGKTWNKFEGPIFSSNYKEPGFIGTANVIQKGPSDWWMYYSSAHWEEIDGKLECIYDIKDARSFDGINWIPMGYCIPLNKGEGGMASPRVIKNDKGNYDMFFSVRGKKDYRINPQDSYRIETAWSVDGNSWDREYDSESMKKEDELMLAYPFIVKEENKYIMFYNTDFGKSGISYAEFKK